MKKDSIVHSDKEVEMEANFYRKLHEGMGIQKENSFHLQNAINSVSEKRKNFNESLNRILE